MTEKQQGEMFPQEARRSSLRYDIPQAYEAVERGIPKIAEAAKVFKSFSEFSKNLNVEKDAAVILGNLDVAMQKAGDLIEAIKHVRTQLEKAHELEAEMVELENALGTPAEFRWKNRPGEDRPWDEKQKFEEQFDDVFD